MTFTEAHYVLTYISTNLNDKSSDKIYDEIKKLKYTNMKQAKYENEQHNKIKNDLSNSKKFETFIKYKNSLENCHQTIFAFSFICSKYEERQRNNWNILNLMCGNCNQNIYNDEEKNEIYEFVRDLNENMIKTCKYIQIWLSDLSRNSLDKRFKHDHLSKENELLKNKIHDLHHQYENFVNVIHSNELHNDAIHKHTLLMNKRETSHSHGKDGIVHETKNDHQNSNTAPLIQQEVYHHNFFKNLKDITVKAKHLETKLKTIIKDLEKDKLLMELSNTSFAEQIAEKIKFLLQNWEKILEKESSQIKKIFKNSGLQFVGYCLSQRFLKAFNENGEVNMNEFLENNVLHKYAQKLSEIMKNNHLDIKLYKSTKEAIEKYLFNKCNNLTKEDDLKHCQSFLENMLQKWQGYCSIDINHLENENIEEIVI